MSRVTNVIVTASVLDETAFKEINRYFIATNLLGFGFVNGFNNTKELHVPVLDCPRCVGGNKALECCIAIGAFNHLDFKAMQNALRSVPWDYREDVRIYVQEQEATHFSTYTLDEQVEEMPSINSIERFHEREDGLAIMDAVVEILCDRRGIDTQRGMKELKQQIATIGAEELYDAIVGPAIDAIEDELAKLEKKNVHDSQTNAG